MLLTRCPVCHSRISLEQCVQDESGRSMLTIITKLDTNMSTGLVTYIGLFRAAKRDLANDRALRLMNEVLELSGNHQALAIALHETVEAMRQKQTQGGFEAMKNHNYLKKVLGSVEQREISHVPVVAAVVNNPSDKPKFSSKTAQGMQSLEALKRGE